MCIKHIQIVFDLVGGGGTIFFFLNQECFMNVVASSKGQLIN